MFTLDKNQVYTYTVVEKGDFVLQNYLKKKAYFSSRLIKSIKREGFVKVNGITVNFTAKIKKGDKITVFLGNEDVDAAPEDIPIDIIYEDDDILVVNKEAGYVTHATLGHPTGNLANAIAAHFLKMGTRAKIRFVNRLDRDTSGVIVIAKNKYVHQFIQNQMKEKNVKKIYYALVEGKPDLRGTIDKPIGRPSEDSIERTVMEGGQRAITHYEVVEYLKDHALLKVSLETGRTHQIRVHLKSIGHPIIGDNLYNKDSIDLINRQALHAWEIEFAHPRYHKMVRFEASLPDDIKNVLEQLRKE